MADEVRKIIAEFTARNKADGDIAAFDKSISRVTSSVKKFSNELLYMAGLGGGIYGVSRLLVDSVREFSAFESGLARISTVLEDQAMGYLPQYERQIKSLASTLGESKTSLTSGLNYILGALIDPADAMGVLESSVRSAKGGFTDAATTIKLTTQILKAYNMEASETNRIQDILHATVKRGVFTFEELAGSVGDVIGLTAFLDIDLEAVGASLSTMTRAGLSADTAVTALKNILNQFINPTDIATEAAAQLGFELTSTSVKGKGLITIIDKLKKASNEQLAALMPNIRGLVGFASQLKNASALGEDYEYILNSAGLAERNLAIQQETSSAKIERLSEKWKNLKTSIGGATIDVIDFFDTLDDKMNKAIGVSQENAAKMDYSYGWGSAMKNAYAGLGVDTRTSKEKNKELQDAIAERDRIIVEAEKVLAYTGEPQTIDAATKIGFDDEEMKKIVADTRDAMDQMRTMDYLTRTERIMNLKAYRAAHADVMTDVVGKETEAGKLINKEIDNLKRSRLDAMQVYATELKDDMQDSALYTSEKWAESARSIEGSMSSAFQSMITEGASFRDAMKGFLNDILSSMSRMYSDMAARGIMNFAMSAFTPAPTGMAATGATGAHVFHGGGIVGIDTPTFTRTVSSSLFANAPRLHEGLRSNERAAILEVGEEVTSKEDVQRGRRGGNVTHNTFYVSAIDAQGVSQFLKKYEREIAATNKNAKMNNYSRR